MNAPNPSKLQVTPPLAHIALSRLAEGLTPAQGPEADYLLSLAETAQAVSLAQWLLAPAEQDRALHALAQRLSLNHAEVIAVALAVAVELEPMAGRVFAWLQAPVALARPSLGLLRNLCEALGVANALPLLLDGAARACGLLQFEFENKPLPEQTVLVPVPIVLALLGVGGQWPSVTLKAWQAQGANCPDCIAFPASIIALAARQADALRHAHGGRGLLAVRSGHPREAREAAVLVAGQLGARAALFEQEPPRGIGPWLQLVGAIPVLCAELAPGEVRRLPELVGYRGPLLIASGIDGSFERGAEPVSQWAVPLPQPAERAALWQAHLPMSAAEALGTLHRHSPVHIQHLAAAARHHARISGDAELAASHVRHVARHGAAGELGTLAQLVSDEISDAALVVPSDLRAALQALRERCQCREGLAEQLGPAARSRYRPGVRGLLVGPSGTGKTLACGWLATQLGLPLYRVDLSAVVSKYIGETEKNLAQLFARAEHAEVVLLFDEADALFGKRTDVKEANDRFANQQTNYLLQRIESFDGIALLTSNSRSRFDSAFTRRLDAIIDFSAPGPQERRDLWQAHLGAAHSLSAGELNRIAASCDLAGGHIRNVVLAAAAAGQGRIDFAALCGAIDGEYRKLGRQAPAGLLG